MRTTWEVLNTVTFEAHEGGIRLTLRAEVVSAVGAPQAQSRAW
ncbi:MAG: hypothetical protein ACFB51_12035 [Anaerolineae bacterium]